MADRRAAAATFHKRFAAGAAAGKRRLGIAFRAAEHALARVFRPIFKDRGFTAWFAQNVNEVAALQHKEELVVARSRLRLKTDPLRFWQRQHIDRMYIVLEMIHSLVQKPEEGWSGNPYSHIRACSCGHYLRWRYGPHPCECPVRYRGGWIHPKHLSETEAKRRRVYRDQVLMSLGLRTI
jgi:acetolactate synthase regulatory subunit